MLRGIVAELYANPTVVRSGMLSLTLTENPILNETPPPLTHPLLPAFVPNFVKMYGMSIMCSKGKLPIASARASF